ncbi:MAG: hypothetical protein U9R34_03410 [Nanoarchaeota archaeon]|nr:hypothetical protein [Nanoarchaeota archaeon]
MSVRNQTLVEEIICNKALPLANIREYEKVHLITEQYYLFCCGGKGNAKPSDFKRICSVQNVGGKQIVKLDHKGLAGPLEEGFIQYLYGLRSPEIYNTNQDFIDHKNRITGDIFEDYCLQLFPEKDFEILACTQRRQQRITDDYNRDAKIKYRNLDYIFNIDFKFRSTNFPFTNAQQAKKYVDYDKYNEFFHIIVGQGNKPYAPAKIYVIPLFTFKSYLDSGVCCSYSLDQYGLCKRAIPDTDFSIQELHIRIVQ